MSEVCVHGKGGDCHKCELVQKQRWDSAAAKEAKQKSAKRKQAHERKVEALLTQILQELRRMP